MERIIAKQIYVHLLDNFITCYLIYSAQHGFVKGHSTCTQHLTVAGRTLASSNLMLLIVLLTATLGHGGTTPSSTTQTEA